MSVRCVICEKTRINSSEFCQYHSDIDRAIKSSYQIWLEAYNGRLSEKEFLARISNLSETGEEAKRVANHLLSKVES